MLAWLRRSHVSLIFLSICGTAAADSSDLSPEQWLDRMASAVQTISYEGTVVRISGSQTVSLKVAHTVSDGVIHERVIAQEGVGREIVREGNEVHRILPDLETVHVEQWNDESTLFSTLPASRIEIGNEYDLVARRLARVAGREAIELAIRPHDTFRYGHRLWLDTETGFLLRTQLIGNDGRPLDEVKFVEISLNAEVTPQSLKTAYPVDSFTWLSKTAKPSRKSIDTAWTATDLPVGFRVVSTQEEAMGDSGKVVTHIMYSDGLANVSAFVLASAEPDSDKHEAFGYSNSFSVSRDGFRITVFGEVPVATVERIARSLELN